jgi:tetratricopeptide (TPR) repeat protein
MERMRVRATVVWIWIVFQSVVTADGATGDETAAAAALQRVRSKVNEMSAGRSEPEVMKEINSWKQREPRSPEPYVIAANYYLKQTMQPTQISIQRTGGESEKSPGAQDQMSILDPKTGKKVGVIQEVPMGPKPSVQTVRKYRLMAAEELAQAEKIAPDRLDIILGRAVILNDLHAWQPLAAEMEIALRRASRDSQKLLWLENKPLPHPASDEVVDSLQSKIVDAFDEESAEGDRRAEQLALLGLKYFPDAVELLSDAGSVRAFAGDWEGAIKSYQRAASIAPDDSIVLSNLAHAYMKIGDVQKARGAAKKVIKLNNDPRSVESATEILEYLSSKDGGRK